MKFRLDYVALPIFLASLVFNCWGWGGATLLNKIGPVISESAAREAPLVQTYMVIGAKAIALAGAQASAIADAEATFGPARAQLLGEQALAMDDLFNEHFSPRLDWLIRLHWVCPLALLLILIGWWFRPKQLQSMGRGRR